MYIIMSGTKWILHGSLILLSSFLLMVPVSVSVPCPHKATLSAPPDISISPFLPEMLSLVNESQLRSYVQTIQGFGPHPTGSASLEALSDYLFDTFASMNITVQSDYWYKKGYSGKNIIATIPGRLNRYTNVILCAHYDSVAVSPGAEDDGSGVAAVLAIADIMRHYSFNITIRFILFSGEEQGLLGSGRYAKNAARNHEDILGVLALDKIGYAVTEEQGHTIQHHANQASAWMITISEGIATYFSNDIGLTVLPLPEDPSSDHYAFAEAGYPASDFVTNTSNPFYHTSEDLIEHMNLSYLTSSCKLSLGTIVTMASFDPRLSDTDLVVSMRGSVLARPAQFSILVRNLKGSVDTANVTVSITLKHLLRYGFVETVKQDVATPCVWTIEKEIGKSFQFDVGAHRFARGLFVCEVNITGRGDDLYLYLTAHTYGIILSPFRVLMIPHGAARGE
jgi:hypothetical protein